jgi:hypothetical protein
VNAPPVTLTVSGRAPDEKTLLDWSQRTAHPVLRALRELTNNLAQNQVQSVTASTTLDLRTDVVLADASAGPLIITPPTASLWERRIIVVKTDASANAVTVQGVNVGVLSSQYSGAEMVCDGTLFYVFTFGGSVAADVTIGPFVVATDQVDYSPVGWSGARYVLLSPSAQSVAIASFDGNVSVKRKTIINVATGDFDLRFSRNSFATSTAANRLQYRKANLVALVAGDSVDIWKDETSGYWRVA